jgi:hypothetical protein
MVSIGTQARAPGARDAGKEPAGRRLLMGAVVVVLAGVRFGSDQGVISGAPEGIQHHADTIFAAGFSTPLDEASATTWAIGGVNVPATFVAAASVDPFRRRPLLLARLVGMAVSLTTIGIASLSLDDVSTGRAHAGSKDHGPVALTTSEA